MVFPRKDSVFAEFSRKAVKIFLVCGLWLLCAFQLSASAGGGTPELFPVAMRSFGVWEPQTNERFDFSVWYPGGNGSAPVPGVKEGWVVEHARRGRIIPGFYPVILLSHDTASSRYANNDLAIALAAGGFVVIVPSHAEDNQSNSSHIYSAILFRDRPRQLLRALETVMESPDFSHYVDESRIGLVGVGFGSISVLQLTGARPELSRSGQHCGQEARDDAFCKPWVRERLTSAAKDMPAMERLEGGGVFLPPLTLYAPRLMPADVPQEVLHAFEAQMGATGERRPRNFWQKLFGADKDDENAAPKAEERFAAQTEEKEDGRGAGPEGDAHSASAAPQESFPLDLDFQGGPLFGGTDSGSPFVYITLTDSPEFRVGVEEGHSADLAAPETPPVKPDASTVFRRPSEARQIRAVALVAPAGGMLFTPEALQGVRMPVAMIEAGKNNLYPPEAHSQPYYACLPAPPLVLRLAKADHFSLFARCSKESRANLGEICGRLTGEEREGAARQRNHFLVNFFQSTLGVPLSPVRPSGFIAVPAGQ